MVSDKSKLQKLRFQLFSFLPTKNSPCVLAIFSHFVEFHIHTSVLRKGCWGCLSAVLSRGCVYTVMEWLGECCVRTPEGSFKVTCKFSIVGFFFFLNTLSAFPAFDPVTAVLCVEVNRNLGNVMWCYIIGFSKSREWNCVLAVGNWAGMHKQALLEQKVNSAFWKEIRHKLR